MNELERARIVDEAVRAKRILQLYANRLTGYEYYVTLTRLNNVIDKVAHSREGELTDQERVTVDLLLTRAYPGRAN